MVRDIIMYNYPTKHNPRPINQAARPGLDIIEVVTVAWHHGHLTLQGYGPSWLIATTWATGATGIVGIYFREKATILY